MPNNTADQQITLPIGADSADNPVAFIDSVADIEPRLVRKYTNLADRTARMVSLSENDISTLAAEDRVEVYDGANQVSLRSRSVFTNAFRTSDAAPINNSTVLVPDAVLFSALPTAGRFAFDLTLFYDSSVAADFKLTFTWPAGVGGRWGVHGPSTAVATGVGTGVWSTAASSGTTITVGGSGTGAANTMMVIARGIILMGGTAGNLQLQYAQNTADPTDTVVRSASKLEVWRVL